MTLEEILIKYPIKNDIWKLTDNNLSDTKWVRCFSVDRKLIFNNMLLDPWNRKFKGQFIDKGLYFHGYTTVEGVGIDCVIYPKDVGIDCVIYPS